MATKRKPARRRGWRVILVLLVLASAALGTAAWLAASGRDARPADSMAAIRAAASQGRWAEVDDRLARWIASHPGDGEALLMRGTLLAGVGRSGDAVDLLRGVPESAPERARAMTTVGEIALRLRDAPQAERAFREAAALDPKEAEPRRRLIYLLSLQQRNGEARDVLWELFRATRDPRVLSSLVQNLSAYENDARGFTAEVDGFLARTPTDPYLRRIKGLSLAMQGRPAEALPHLEAAAGALADDPVGRFALAECLLTLGRFRGDESLLGPDRRRPPTRRAGPSCAAGCRRPSAARTTRWPAIARPRPRTRATPRPTTGSARRSTAWAGPTRPAAASTGPPTSRTVRSSSAAGSTPPSARASTPTRPTRPSAPSAARPG